MIKYNTENEKLILPEYGRNIQKMVDYCIRIEDREERTRCAHTIADIMSVIASGNNKEKATPEKIWDQLNIISGFRLDIDFPVEVMKEEELNIVPSSIPYSKSFSKFRHYGKNVQEMLKIVADMDNCIEKDNLIFLIANQMKKQLVSRNPELATDIRIFNDIKEITFGKITIDPENYRLNDYIGVTENDNSKKKKKNKNNK